MEEMIFGRRYRVTEKIGTGGMAEVYKAVDETLGRTVAVKVMHPRYAADPTFAARFRQEAQAAANLQSPYIVNIYDWGQDGDTYYIVMELVRGTDLKSIIQEKGALDSRRVAEIGAQVCSALSVAHGYDVIHRDVKPHNIMITPDGVGEGHGLWHRSRRQHHHDADRLGARHRALRLPRAGAGPTAHCTKRPVLTGHRAVRGSHRETAVRRRYPGGRRAQAGQRGGPASSAVQPRHRSRARGRHRHGDGEGPDRPLRHRRRHAPRPA